MSQWPQRQRTVWSKELWTSHLYHHGSRPTSRTSNLCTPRAWPRKPAGDPVGVQNGDHLFLCAAHSFYCSSNASSFLLPISGPILSSFPISTLLDCGASDNFIDTSIAPLHLIYALPEPISLFLFDGSPTPSGVITHAINLTITVPGFAPK